MENFVFLSMSFLLINNGDRFCKLLKDLVHEYTIECTYSNVVVI